MILLETETWEWTRSEMFFTAVRVGALLVLGFPLVWLLGRWAKSRVGKTFTVRQGMLAGKFIFYG
ncbi:MAG: hypothetical protein ACYS47_18205, partial [Planctomycetota bacterium]